MKVQGPLFFREAALQAPRGTRLLHPAIWFVVVWLVIMSIWASVSEETFLRVTGSDRYSSLSSFTFMALMLAAFIVGTLIGPGLLRLHTSPVRTVDEDPQRAVRILGIATVITFVLSSTAILYIIAGGVAKAGGPAAIIQQFRSGVPLSHMAESYFIPSRIQGLTIWAQLNPASAALGILALTMDDRRSGWSRALPPMLIVGFVLTLTLSFVLLDRLAAYEYLVVLALTWMGARLYQRKPVFTISIIVRVLMVGLIGGSVWFGAEFARTYLARFGPTTEGSTSSSDQLTPSEVAGDSLLAYFITGPNNALYAVDHTEKHTYVYRTFKGVFTTMSLDRPDAPLFGEGIADASRQLSEIYYGHLRFTVFSFVGNAFFDLGWGGLLIGFWFGLIVGAVYYKFSSGELWALLIYPFLFVGVLDSWRVTYWAESRMQVPVLTIIVVSVIIYRGVQTVTARSEPTVRALDNSGLARG